MTMSERMQQVLETMRAVQGTPYEKNARNAMAALVEIAKREHEARR